MRVTCIKCGVNFVTSPSSIKVNTPGTYICPRCQPKYRKVNHNPNWNAYRKICKLSEATNGKS